ncbi:MAG: SH3 domain-containing protein [Candidatus Aminicenantaceae bacterium]
MKFHFKGPIVVISFLFIFLMVQTGIIKAENSANIQQSNQKEMKVRVVVLKANLKLRPEENSMNIAEVTGGSILNAKEDIGEWYKVNLPPDKEGFVVSGYIHKNQVRVYEEEKVELKEQKEKKEEVKLKQTKEADKKEAKEDKPKEKKPVYKPYQHRQQEFQEPKEDFSERLSVGFGLGPLYASFGINVEFDPWEYVGFFGALGLAEDNRAGFFEFWEREKVAFAVGARFYPLNFFAQSDFFFRPRIGLSYGYNGIYWWAVYSYGYPQPNYKCLNGINISVGSDFEIYKGLGLDFDVFIPITRWSYNYDSLGNKIVNWVENRGWYLSFGIRYNFFLDL